MNLYQTTLEMKESLLYFLNLEIVEFISEHLVVKGNYNNQKPCYIPMRVEMILLVLYVRWIECRMEQEQLRYVKDDEDINMTSISQQFSSSIQFH